jgi:hypothetical protein
MSMKILIPMLVGSRVGGYDVLAESVNTCDSCLKIVFIGEIS